MLFTPPFDIPALINRIMVGVLDPHAGRFFSHNGIRTMPWTIYFLISIIDSIFFIISFVKWKEHSNRIKFLIIILAIFELFFWRGTGTNFGSFMMITSILFTVIASSKVYFIEKKQVYKYIFFCIFLCVVMLIIFSSNMEGRVGGDFNNLDSLDPFKDTQVFIDENHFIYQYLPYRLQQLFTLVFSYLTQGYTFLEYIYTLNFHWGMGWGNNPGAQSFATDFLGFNPEINSYQLQIEQMYGVDRNIYWHSCYLWLANDFTILGIPIVIFYISKLCSYALIMYMTTKDVISGIIFVIFSTMLLFLFANNNYISTMFYSLFFIFPYWYFKKYKRIVS